MSFKRNKFKSCNILFFSYQGPSPQKMIMKSDKKETGEKYHWFNNSQTNSILINLIMILSLILKEVLYIIQIKRKGFSPRINNQAFSRIRVHLDKRIRSKTHNRLHRSTKGNHFRSKFKRPLEEWIFCWLRTLILEDRSFLRKRNMLNWVTLIRIWEII